MNCGGKEMSVTILGQNIHLIRPKKIDLPIIRKEDLPKPSYNKRSRTIKQNSGKVISICIKLKNGGVRATRKGLHSDVMETFDIDPLNVDKIGWELENGNFVWK